MPLSRARLEADLALLVDPATARLLISSYVEMQQRYVAGDWKPAELDGGQFCETVARALFQVDAGKATTDLPGKIIECLFGKGKTTVAHRLDDKARDHFCRVLQTTYKFRSDRGVAHISPTYTANFADATLIVTSVKWMFAEFLRLAWNSDRNKVAAIIEAITQLEHPLVHELDGKPLVLHSALSAPEEILVLLSHSSSGRLSREELKSYVQNTPSAVTMAISRLISSREIREGASGDIAITPTGEKRVRETITPKLASFATPKSPPRKHGISAARRKK